MLLKDVFSSIPAVAALVMPHGCFTAFQHPLLNTLCAQGPTSLHGPRYQFYCRNLFSYRSPTYRSSPCCRLHIHAQPHVQGIRIPQLQPTLGSHETRGRLSYNSVRTIFACTPPSHFTGRPQATKRVPCQSQCSETRCPSRAPIHKAKDRRILVSLSTCPPPATAPSTNPRVGFYCRSRAQSLDRHEDYQMLIHWPVFWRRPCTT
jgi:hypothetical protein